MCVLYFDINATLSSVCCPDDAANVEQDQGTDRPLEHVCSQ